MGRGRGALIGIGPFQRGTWGNGQFFALCVALWQIVQVIFVIRDALRRSRASLRSFEWRICRMFFQIVGSGDVLTAEML